MKFTLRGTGQMRAKLAKIRTDFPGRVEKALEVEANIEMLEAKRRTPIDVNYEHGRKPPHPGQLRRSGMVHKPVREGDKLSITLSFGGLADDYAVYVHERPPEDVYHPIGQWKYLESVLNESRPFMLDRLGARLRFGR